MANTYNAIYKRYNGTSWDTFYFATTANQVAEAEDRKWLKLKEQNAINHWLGLETSGSSWDTSKFNIAGGLVYVEQNGTIPVSLIPGGSLAFLPLTGGTMTGDILMSGKKIQKVSELQTNKIVNNGASSLALEGFTVIDLKNTRVINASDPIDPQDFTTKSYVDTMNAQATHIAAAVIAASTSNIATLSGTLTIDGKALEVDDRVLLKDQTTASQNGVYIVKSTSWVKVPNDSDKGSLVSVLEGSTNKNKQYYNNGTSWILYWIEDGKGVLVNGGLELDATGLLFGIANNAITTARIADGAVSVDKLGNIDLNNNKFSTFASGLASSMTNPTIAKVLNDHLKNIYKMVLEVKGSTNVHDTQKQQDNSTALNIATLYSGKNKTEMGTGNPNGTNYIAGDVYIQYTAN